MSEFAPLGIGQIDTSGGWTDGLEIGSPEWVDTSLKFEIARSLVEGASPEELMGLFDNIAEGREI